MATEQHRRQIAAFRRRSDGKYLSATSIHGQTYLQFTAAELTDKTVAHEIIDAGNGLVRMRSMATGHLWERSPTSNWILVSSDGGLSDHNLNTLFRAVKLDETEVAYMNQGNQMFCKTRSPEGQRECLIAPSPDLTDVARMELVDIPLLH